MSIVFAVVLGGLVAWIGWLWPRTPAWTSLLALVPVGLGAWCTIAMALAFVAAARVPATLAVREQLQLVAMHEERAYRWGLRFWAAGLVSAGWMLFVMWRWNTLDAPPQSSR